MKRSNCPGIVVLFVLVVGCASIASHLVAFIVGIPEIREVKKLQNPSGFVEAKMISLGSSLRGFAINGHAVADAMDWQIESMGCGAGSPAEFEWLIKERMVRKGLLIFTSVFEMSEGMISPSRTVLVPFTQSLRDTWDMALGWDQTKALLWQYPLGSMQALFPTLGRAWEVQVLVRERIRSMLGKSKASSSQDGPIELAPESNQRTDTILTWDAGRLERNVAQMLQRNVLLHNDFIGPKEKALKRILSESPNLRSTNFVIILPVSPEYLRRFVDQDAEASFNRALAGVQQKHPSAHIIRLDQEPSLQKDGFFWDLVHMNSNGQKAATEMLITRLREISSVP